MTFYTHLDWPLGRLLLVSDGQALTGLHFVDGRYAASPEPAWREEPDASPFGAARTQLRAYWEGRRHEFDLPLRLQGTVFQHKVWDAIALIPFGQTISYRELASRAGSPEAMRAAGLATGRNPVAIVVPCHRVVGSDGTLTGYGGGLDRKRALLAFEAEIASGLRATLGARGLLAGAS